MEDNGGSRRGSPRPELAYFQDLWRQREGQANGALDFGTWQRIFYAEYDGRRSKRVLVKVIGA